MRALAVLCVVAFHAFPKTVPGGFIGVDIFFVISGYLITSILLQDMEQGSFSLADFYMRRIRRIFPALIVVLFCVLLVAPVILFSDEYARLGKYVLSAAGFLSNIVLGQEIGYFDGDSNTKILLHFWSLGIEEQFYICFPLLLLLCFKRTHVLLPLALLFLLSFAENIFLTENNSFTTVNRAAAFYSPFSRAWELLAGALLSALHHSPRTRKFFLWLEGAYCAAQGRQTGNDRHAPGLILAIAGGVCIALALGITDTKVVWPGWRALLPVLGAVLLIAAGSANPVNRYLLSNRTAVFIGRISYPLYLWHWPLLSYAGIIVGGLDHHTRLLRCILVGSAFLLAIMTYFWIERPIRFSKRTSPKMIIALCIAVAILGAWGWYIYIGNQSTFVINGDFHAEYFYTRLVRCIFVGSAFSLAILTYFLIERSICFSKRTSPQMIIALCISVVIFGISGRYIYISNNFFENITNTNDINYKISAPFEEINVVIIGDSHAEHLFPGLEKRLHDKQRLAFFSASCAAPYIGIASAIHKEYFTKELQEFIQKSYERILQQKNITTVILAHNPSCSYDEGIKDIFEPEVQDKTIMLEHGMRRTFSALTKAGKDILVILDNPHLPFDPLRCKKRPFSTAADKPDCFFNREFFDNDAAINWYKAILERVLQDYPAVTVIDLSPYFCDDAFCYAEKAGKHFYRDRGHLSMEGSLLVAPEIIKHLDPAISGGSIHPVTPAP